MAKVLNRRRLGAMACVLALASLTGCFGVVPRSGSGNGFALLTDVRSANNGTFDRTVFDGDRPGAPVLFNENTDRRIGPIFRLRVSGDF